jgi:streptogramin lyase
MSWLAARPNAVISRIMHWGRGVFACGMAAIGTALFTLPAAAQTAPVVTEFSQGLAANSIPNAITAGPDGNLWFTTTGFPGFPGTIGRITPTGNITEFSQGSNQGNGLEGITAGPDGNLWFVDAANKAVGRITTIGIVTEFSQGFTNGDFPEGSITSGPDGNLWFGSDIASIARITPIGVITEFFVNDQVDGGLSGGAITAGPDGNVWYSGFGNSGIGEGLGNISRITPTGSVTELFQGLNPDSMPTSIVLGPDGNLWFTDDNFSLPAIGRITPAGVITEFSQGLSPGDVPFGIAAGADGNLWFISGNTLGRITPAGIITEFPQAFKAGSVPGPITAGPDGNLWFTDQGSTPAIGRITIAPSIPSELVSSVLPGSRSVEIGNPATIFATVINTSANALDNCQIALPISAPAGLSLSYQTTDPKTNTPIGTPNTPATIPGDDGIQTFLLAFAGTAVVSVPGLPLQFECDGSTPATSILGVNTVDLTFSAAPIADIIALAATQAGGGTEQLPNGGAGAFSVASFNVGATATLAVSVDTGAASLPLTAVICQSNPQNGQCLDAAASSVSVDFADGSAPTFSVFLQSSGPIPFAPAASRVFVRFKDTAGGLHGSTSVAVTTN